MDPIQALQKAHHLTQTLRDSASTVTSLCAETPSPDEGISLLQAKAATLLRYNLNLLRLARQKINGKPITHLAESLVEDWVALEKMRPLERKLRHQIDALLKSDSQRGTEAEYRPDPTAVVLDSDGEQPEGAYRPPRLAEVAYDAEAPRLAERERREKERNRIRVVRSEGVRELLAEVGGRPEVVREGGERGGRLGRMIQEDEERRRFEEDNFMRVTVSKKDRKRRKEIERLLERDGVGRDELEGLAGLAERVVGPKGERDGKKRRKRG